jgi:phage-related protein
MIAICHRPPSIYVLEVVEDYEGDTFRAVYTVKCRDAVFVLRIKTPKPDMELVKQRFKLAEAWYHKQMNDDD